MRLYFILFISLFTVSGLLAQSPDHENMQLKLDRNRKTLRYLDVSLSNLSEGEMKKNLTEKYALSLKYDYFGKLYYLAGNYGRCFKELNDSQKIQNDILEVLLEFYMARTHLLLEEAGPQIVKADDKIARFYVQNGYRQMKKADIYLTQANNLSKYLISDQNFLYNQSLLTLRKARRFGIRAHIEARIPMEEKKEYTTVTLDDIAEKDLDILNQSEFEKLQNSLQSLIASNQLKSEFTATKKGEEIKFSILDMNVDSFTYYIPGRKSLYLDLSMALNADGMKEKEKARLPGDPVQSDFYYKQ